MSALGIDDDGVDAHRVELPFPPDIRPVVALAAADAVGAVTRLQHQPLAKKRPRLLALLGQLLPRVGGNGRADADRQTLAARLRFDKQAIDELFEQSAAHMLRFAAQVVALALEQIIGNERDRQFAHRLFADDFAAEPLLQAREDREAIKRVRREFVFGRNEHDKLAVYRHAGRERARQRFEIRISVGDQLFAARP